MERPLSHQLDHLGFPAAGVGQSEMSDFEAPTARGHGLPSGVGKGFRFLSLFAGPAGRWDGLAAAPHDMGAERDEHIILDGERGTSRATTCRSSESPSSSRSRATERPEARHAARSPWHVYEDEHQRLCAQRQVLEGTAPSTRPNR